MVSPVYKFFLFGAERIFQLNLNFNHEDDAYEQYLYVFRTLSPKIYMKQQYMVMSLL